MTDQTLPPLDLAPDLVAAAQVSKAWPFEEARKIVERLERKRKACADLSRPVLFETGYGPSGLPHIGTFGEVARTTMVRTAFRLITEDRVATRLLSFSDDMDGMRKVPENVPNRDLLAQNLGKPLTKVPDPFGTHESFGHHNNARLRAFLDHFGFDYEFASASDYYARGVLDEKLLVMLERYDAVMEIMLPTLREERRRTYSPFLPVHPETGVVMQVPVDERNLSAGTIVWTDPDTGRRYETPVTGGGAKAQWKPDWALRWAALGVDYEMSGKDHIENVKTSAKICRVLGAEPPDGFNYELVLDEKGEKISKSKGNGITIEEWLDYASPESLSLYMFQKPKTAKRLHFDVIPRAVDEYFSFLDAFPQQAVDLRLGNPVWHIHSGRPPQEGTPVAFSMLLNLVNVSDADDKAVLWAYLTRYQPDLSPETHPTLDALIGHAVRYYNDVVKPGKVYREPDATMVEALDALDKALAAMPQGTGADTIQTAVFDIGRRFYPDPTKKGPDGNPPGVSLDWFRGLYQVLLGQDQGPRFGSFVAIYGIAETRERIFKALQGELAGGQKPAGI